jgi:heme exporter protein D
MIFALPFALVFGAPVFLSVKFFEKYRRVYAYNKTCLYFSSFLIFCFSFLLDPLVWLVFTVGFVPFIIYIVHHSLEQRARVNQYSENNVRERLGIRNL